jgi:tRNA (uracil-5-)-methyltransferase TRM9
MSKSIKSLESDHVIKIYDKIAKEFDKTRIMIWKSVGDFLKNIEPGSLIADIGAGNGKNAEVRKDCMVICSDASSEMVKICKDKGFESVLANATKLPFQDNKFDYTMCVAVIHHLATKENRKLAVDELIRITKPGGKIFIQVWSYEAFNKSKKDGGSGTMTKPVSDSDDQDQYVRWTQRNDPSSILYRYYHFFKQGELDSLVNDCGTVIDSFIDHTNYGIIILKK